MSFKWPSKDPDDILDYAIDWTARIDTGDSITESEWIQDEGTVVINSHAIDGAKTTVWLSGGTDGEIASITNRVTTQGGRQMDQTVSIKVKTN